MTVRAPVSAASALLTVLALAGCSSTEDARARTTAEDFYTAVQAQDGATACEHLAPSTRGELEQSAGTSCERAILAEDVPAVTDADRVEVYDSMAQVRYAEDTIFLTAIDGTWRVLAAACTRRPRERPYDCAITGG